MRDYRAWHRDYDDPRSGLSQRLRVVQQRLSEQLSAMPPGPIQVISMCAGQGRDIIGVLVDHARRADVRARLVELDAENVAWAREAARRHGLTALEIVEADAALSDAYAGLVPADVLLVCGILGNIPEADIERTVQHLSMLGRCGTTVIWTRHRNPPDFTPTLRRWFSDSGYDEVSFDSLNNERNPAIGVHRLRGPALPFRPGFRFFTFVR